MNRSWRSPCIFSSAWCQVVCLSSSFPWLSEINNNNLQQYIFQFWVLCESLWLYFRAMPFHLEPGPDLISLLCFVYGCIYPLLSKYNLYSWFLSFGSLLYLIQETRQQGSGEGQSTLSIRDSCSSQSVRQSTVLYCNITHTYCTLPQHRRKYITCTFRTTNQRNVMSSSTSM